MSNELTNENEKQPSLEEIFKNLDEVIGMLQSKELTLEETFAGYKKGLELVEQANGRIEKIESDIRLLDPSEQILD